MYVLKTRFQTYVTGVVADGRGMIENASDQVDDALRWDTTSDLISFLRALPALAHGEQNHLTIHRVEAPDVPPLVDMGPLL